VFTGIIEHAGEVAGVEVREDGARLVVAAGPVAAGTRIGDSVAVNGVCLTVVEQEGERIAFDAVQETLRRTNLGSLRVGERVNLERPLRVDGRFDGHFVQGHVDGTATLESITEEGNSRRLRLRAAAELLRYIVRKGSVALDGISLTVAAVAADWFEVVIIPHTWQVTNLGNQEPGAVVNIEVDLLAKYVERLVGNVKCQMSNDQ
jgi:riboflavin synthase